MQDRGEHGDMPAPHLEVGILGVLREGLEVVERTPVLHDREPHRFVPEQPLFRVRHEVLQHVVHALAAPEVAHARGLAVVLAPVLDEVGRCDVAILGVGPKGASVSRDEGDTQRRSVASFDRRITSDECSASRR